MNNGQDDPSEAIGYVGRFNFDLATALGEQLKIHFERDLRAEPLTEDRIGDLDRTQGVYALYRADTLVYIGQADDLKRRLGEHKEKIAGRMNINLAEMSFTCTYIDMAWVPLTHEKSLLAAFKTNDVKCDWNGTGFGAHDPGRNRETTNKKPYGFDSQFPIKRDWPCKWVRRGRHNARKLLELVKGGLPFCFRYQVDNPKNFRLGSELYNDLKLAVPKNGMPFDELLGSISKQLSAGWQATIFPGHAILYKEEHRYTHGEIV